MSKQAGKPKTSRSLAATLTVAFLALSLATLLIANLSLFLLIGRAIQESVDSKQQLAAQEAAQTVASFIQEKFSVLETAIRLGGPTSAPQEEQKRTLEDLLGLDRAFRQSILLDSQGQELAKVSRISQTAAGQLMDRVDNDVLAQVKQGNRYISSVYIDEATSEPMVVMAVPAADILGDFQGTLLAEVNLKFMWDLVDRLKVGETGLAYVVDRQGNLLAFGDISRVLRGENVSHLDTIGTFMRNPVPAGKAATSVFQGINGTTVVGTYVPLGVPDWAVATEMPLAEAYRPGIQSAVIAVFVMLVVALFAGLSAVYMARRLAAPLLNLTATAGRIAGGEMDLQAAIAGPTEVASLATAFNSMTAQLREFIGSLEQRVAERTQQLEAAAEIARATTSVLDPDELLRQTVDLVRERFDLYYVGLFLLDEERRFAVLRAGTGEAGQKMIGQQHKLQVGGDSMIGQCTVKAEAIIALDVGEEAVRFDNPLLPDTRSEMALPLRARGRVIGAMTAQSIKEAAFGKTDVAVMQTMADQVAVAIDNARLFTQSEQALEAERRAYGELSGQAWQELTHIRPDLGFVSDQQGVVPIGDLWEPEMEQAVRTGEATPGDGDGSVLAIPIKVRGNVIGVVDAHKPGDTREWTAEEITLMKTLTDQLAQALESARLYQDTQRRAIRERLVGEVTVRMRETLDLETVLKMAASEMRRALSLDDLVIRLATPEMENEAD